MEYGAGFHFFNSLNDFILKATPDTGFEYRFDGTPSVKDAIEAIGVPHTEVDAIAVDGNYVDFYYRLKDKDQVEVFPLINIADLTINSLTSAPVYPLSFIADVHAGKLARQLRMLGVDTVYQNNFTDQQLADIAEKENRIVLTRDVGLLKFKKIKWGHWLRSQHVNEQLREILDKFNLRSYISPLVRCIDCNGLIVSVSKEEVLQQLLPQTIQHFSEFYQCKSCKKVYWKGSHYEHMQAKISNITTTIK